jgi:BASS family bile acid:Na+ symporter
MIHWLHVPVQLAQALIVWAASPSMTAAIVFASLLGLDVSLATSISTLSIIVVPLTGPLLINWLAGVAGDMDVLTMMGRTAAFIGGALAVAWVVRRLSGPAALEKRANELNGAIIILLVLFGVSLMGGVSERLISDPGHIIEYVAAAFVANLVAQITSSILFAWDGSWRSATAALLSGNRNMSVLCANLGTATTPDIMLFFAASHVPIYLLPWILRKAYDWAGRSGCAEPERGLLRS